MRFRGILTARPLILRSSHIRPPLHDAQVAVALNGVDFELVPDLTYEFVDDTQPAENHLQPR
jgi:hypothetical protein